MMTDFERKEIQDVFDAIIESLQTSASIVNKLVNDVTDLKTRLEKLEARLPPTSEQANDALS